jgi:RNA polymerase sigma-70 factor (ECF subfamily)
VEATPIESDERPRHRPPPSRAVLEELRLRDPAAMGAFFEHYFDLVFGLVFHLLADRTAAEDVTQEVFYKVYRAAHQLDPTRDPAPWLTAIAYNACRDLWRSGTHRMGLRSASIDDDPAVAERLTHGTNDPERDTLANERERRVQEAVAELPEPLRTTIVLHDYQGLSHQEIAKLLEIEHAAARKRYSRALAALAGLLQDLGPNP